MQISVFIYGYIQTKIILKQILILSVTKYVSINQTTGTKYAFSPCISKNYPLLDKRKEI